MTEPSAPKNLKKKPKTFSLDDDFVSIITNRQKQMNYDAESDVVKEALLLLKRGPTDDEVTVRATERVVREVLKPHIDALAIVTRHLKPASQDMQDRYEELKANLDQARAAADKNNELAAAIDRYVEAARHITEGTAILSGILRGHGAAISQHTVMLKRQVRRFRCWLRCFSKESADVRRLY